MACVCEPAGRYFKQISITSTTTFYLFSVPQEARPKMHKARRIAISGAARMFEKHSSPFPFA